MSFWFWHGLRRGIQSTGYPRRAEAAPGISPGRPVNTEFPNFRRGSERCVNLSGGRDHCSRQIGLRGSREMRALPALPPVDPFADELGSGVRMDRAAC